MIDLSRANVIIKCDLPANVDSVGLAQAINDVIRSLTGSNVQVITNSTQKQPSPMDMHMARNNSRNRWEG